MKTHKIVSLFALVALIGALRAEPTVIVKSLVASKYLAFTSGLPLDKDRSLETLLLVLYPNGFNFSLWNATDFEKWNSSLGSEVDYGVGWSGRLGKDFTVDAGVVYFDEPSVGTLGAGDIWYGSLRVSRNVSGATFSASYEKYVTAPGSRFRIGSLYGFGASKDVALPSCGLTIKNSVAVAYNTAGSSSDNGFLFRGTVIFDWKLSDRWTLTLPQVNYYLPLNIHDARKTDAVILAGLARRF